MDRGSRRQALLNLIPFEEFANQDPDAACVVESDGRAWSRTGVLQVAMGLVGEFRRAGVTAGDTVTIVSPNCVEYLAAYLAAVFAGLYFVPVNRHLTPGEISYVIGDSGSSLLLLHAAVADIETSLTGQVSIVRIGAHAPTPSLSEWPSLRAPVPGGVVFYTSATTGRPKGVRRPGYDTLEALRKVSAFHRSLDIGEGLGEVHLCAGPLYHTGPFEFAWVALNRGHKIVLAGKWDPEECLRTIDRHRVTTSFMVPTMFIRMLRLPVAIRGKYDHRSLKVVPHAGAPCPRHVKQQMLDWWGPVLFEGYGATEATGTYVGPADWRAHPGTVGKPIPGADVRVLDENHDEVARGVAGRIYIKPYSTAGGFEYLNDPKKTRACQHGDYVYVGDIGYLDEEGYLFLCDRQVDMIITGGVNVYSAEVEEVLSMHAAVADCAVVGEPDDDLGERVTAFVQLSAGVAPDDEMRASIADFLGARLARHKRPKVLRFTESLPRDPNGKLLKRLLRAAIPAGLNPLPSHANSSQT